MSGHDIIVIGASAGGVTAMRRLVQSLPPDLAAAIFIVLHIPADSPSYLPKILSHAGPLQALHPTHTMTINKGCIYVAPPDHHLIIEHGSVRTIRGPRENRHRPAVDPLFRSAALAYGPRVIGVILTGALDDGTSGLFAVKQRGGTAVVQDPREALYASMPESALNFVQVDHCVSLEDMGPLLVHLVQQPAPEESAYPISETLRKEVSISKMERNEYGETERVGTPSNFSCPECGGVLQEVQDGDIRRFRCQVGHAFSTESMQSAKQEQLEEMLWAALKTAQEQMHLSRRMAQQARQHGQHWLVERFEKHMAHEEQRANKIRDMLIEQDEPEEIDENVTSEEGGE